MNKKNNSSHDFNIMGGFNQIKSIRQKLNFLKQKYLRLVNIDFLDLFINNKKYINYWKNKYNLSNKQLEILINGIKELIKNININKYMNIFDFLKKYNTLGEKNIFLLLCGLFSIDNSGNILNEFKSEVNNIKFIGLIADVNKYILLENELNKQLEENDGMFKNKYYEKFIDQNIREPLIKLFKNEYIYGIEEEKIIIKSKYIKKDNEKNEFEQKIMNIADKMN